MRQTSSLTELYKEWRSPRRVAIYGARKKMSETVHNLQGSLLKYFRLDFGRSGKGKRVVLIGLIF